MDKKAFAERFTREGVTARDARDLYSRLTELSADGTLEELEHCIQRCVQWVRKKNRRIDAVGRASLFVEALQGDETFAQRFAKVIGGILSATRSGPMLETGIPNERGIWEETGDRLSRKFLPTPRDERDLAAMVSRIFKHSADPAWIEALPVPVALALMSLIASRVNDPWANLRSSVGDTLAVLATRTSALGLAKDIRARSPESAVTASPFYQLPRAIDDLLSNAGGSTDVCRGHISACHSILDAVLQHLDQFGVSVDLVYRIEVMSKYLDRIEELLEFRESDSERHARGATFLLSHVVKARIQDRSFRDLVGTNVHLLARKIIERVGHTGEHYITTTRSEYAKMLVSAGGGGVLTSFTAYLKFWVVNLHMAPFVEGFLASTNYAASFVLMQFLGFTLATKQPSMTAAALANALKQADSEVAIEDLGTMVARTARSQIAAAIGNIGLVIPAAFALDYGNKLLYRVHVLHHEKALTTISSLHPFKTGTIFYAALTGVLLWLSSICAGWLENWAVFRRIPEGIEGHPIRRIVGRRATAWFARKFLNNLAGVGGSTVLGFMLGMTPVFGAFMGLPVDVRHVTLSTGSLTFAMCALGREGFSHGFGMAALGILMIFICNLSVSFTLALIMAIRARGATNVAGRLTKVVLKRFITRPWHFFLPPSNPRPLAKEAEVSQNGTHGHP